MKQVRHRTVDDGDADALVLLLQAVERNRIRALGGDDVRDEACIISALVHYFRWCFGGDDVLAAGAGQLGPEYGIYYRGSQRGGFSTISGQHLLLHEMAHMVIGRHVQILDALDARGITVQIPYTNPAHAVNEYFNSGCNPLGTGG